MWNTIRIWTRVAVSISYEDNHYTIGTSIDSWPCLWYSSIDIIFSRRDAVSELGEFVHEFQEATG